MANPSVSNVSPPKDESTGSAKPSVEKVKADADALIGEAQNLAGKVAAEATGQVGQIAEQAKAQVAEQAGKLKGFVGEQKDFLAAQVGGVADAMERVASDLEGSNGSSAHYARVIADNADKLSATIQQNDVDALVNMAQDFGRKQPAAFVGVAALLGFAASRFLLASAKRQSNSPNTGFAPEGAPMGQTTSGADRGTAFDSGSV